MFKMSYLAMRRNLALKNQLLYDMRATICTLQLLCYPEAGGKRAYNNILKEYATEKIFDIWFCIMFLYY